jgi:hypothetical protein
MADKEKSIIERALMDAKRIQETLNANTKEILRSIAKEEIDGLVKESLTDESYVEEEINPNLNEEEKDEEIEDVELEDEESENEEESEEEDEEEMESDEEEMDSEEENDNEELTSDEQEPMFGDEEKMDSNMDDETGEDFEEIDMTDSSDINDVISIYKKLTGDDEIEVVFDKEDDEMEVKVTEPGEFIVKNVSKANNAEEEIEDEFNEMDESGIMYEIEMDEDYMNEESEEMHDEEDMLEEKAINNLGDKKRMVGKANIGQPSIFKNESATKKALTESENKYNTLLTETKELKSKNDEYKHALKNFRTMLAETVVFNSNLTYVTKLFMEHSTTKEEKQNILKRFDDEVTTIKESKRLYKTIANELSSKTPIKESIEKSLVKEAASSTSKQIHESTAYVDKETQRIMDLMRRVENR